MTTVYPSLKSHSVNDRTCPALWDVLQEEHIHEMHADGWVRRLAKAGGAVRATLVASLFRQWDETQCWFGPEDDLTMQSLYHEGF